jgi:hypothetical protein
MVFSLVNQFIHGQSHGLSVGLSNQDWDARRVKDLGVRPQTQEVQNPAVVAVASSHWITSVCWVENINPESLALAPMFLSQIKLELAALQKLDPLEVYAAALESLTLVEEGEEEDFEFEEEPDDACVT